MTHGTRAAYQRCRARCADCREANARYERERVRKAAGKPMPEQERKAREVEEMIERLRREVAAEHTERMARAKAANDSAAADRIAVLQAIIREYERGIAALNALQPEATS